MAFKVYKSSAWRNPATFKVFKGGSWQNVKTMWEKINGEWVQTYNSAPWTWYIKLESSTIWIPLDNNSISLDVYTDSDNQEFEAINIKYVDPNGNSYIDTYSIESASTRTVIRSDDTSPSLSDGSTEIILDSNQYGYLPKTCTFYVSIYSDESEVIRSTNYATLTVHEPPE